MEKDLIEFIAKSIVQDASSVRTIETENENGKLIELKVAESDIGRIVGKYGRIAKALRTVLNASKTENHRRCALEIAG